MRRGYGYILRLWIVMKGQKAGCGYPCITTSHTPDSLLLWSGPKTQAGADPLTAQCRHCSSS